jgi:hypothetical protein
MRKITAIGGLMLLLCVLGVQADTPGAREISATVLVIEGEVTAVYERPAEGGLDVIGASVACGDGTHEILLAPRAALEEIGFGIEPGDRVRARLFSSEDDGSSRVQKILNRTRGEMVRLRTLRRDPLWDGTGHWHGSAPGDGQSVGTTPDRPGAGARTRGAR